jgi:hypothetical protein
MKGNFHVRFWRPAAVGDPAAEFNWPEESTEGNETFELVVFSSYEVVERAPYFGETRAWIGDATWKRLGPGIELQMQMALRSPCLVISRATSVRVRRLLGTLLRLVSRYLSSKPSGRVGSIT